MEKIIVKNLTKRTKNFYLDVSFSVHAGEVFALCGISESGKTLASKILQRLAYPGGGDIKINYREAGMVIPDQMFYPNKTVYKTVKMYAKINKRHVNNYEIMNTLNLVGLRSKKDMLIRDLAPNRYARLKIAVAIVSQPKVLIMDSPFSYMSNAEAREIRVVLKTMADRFGTAVFLTAVNFFGVEEIFDTAAIIETGRILTIKSYNDISGMYDNLAKLCITSPQPNYAAKLLEDSGLQTYLFGERDVVINIHPDKAQRVFDFLREKNIDVECVTRVNKSVQDIFHRLRTRDHDIAIGAELPPEEIDALDGDTGVTA